MSRRSMPSSFEWSPAKAHLNLHLHRVSFAEAASVFLDPLAASIRDEAHSTPEEERLILVGLSDTGRVILVSYTERGEAIRLISARRATKRERQAYEDEA